MKKLLLTSTLLFTSISCMKDHRREMIAQQKKELQATQTKISTLITAFVKTDIIVKSEELIIYANDALKKQKVSNENKAEFEQAVKNLNYFKKELEDKIENAKEDLDLSKDPNNGLKLLGSIYILAKHEKVQNKIIEILNEISKNIEIILKINKEKKFLDNTDMLDFQKLVPKCKGMIKALSSNNSKNKNENDVKIAVWVSQMEQFRVLSDNRSVEIDENLRNSMKSIVEKAKIAIEEKNFSKLDELKGTEALPIIEKLFNILINKSKNEKLTDQEKIVLIQLGKTLEKPEALIIGRTTSIAEEYWKINELIKETNLQATEEWRELQNRYNFVINAKAKIPSFEDAIEFENNFKEAFKLKLKFEDLFKHLKNRIIELKDLKIQKKLLRKIDYLEIKLEDMRKKLTEEKKKTN